MRLLNPTRFVSSLVLSATALIITASVAHAQLTNAGFEDPHLAVGTFTRSGINGWSSFGVSGVFDYRTISQLTSSPIYTSQTPEGTQAGYVGEGTTNPNSIAQQSSLVLGTGTTTVTTAFGRRTDGFNGVASYELYAGGTVSNGAVTGGTLLTSLIVDTSTLTSGQFTDQTLTYTALANNAFLGQALSVRINLTSGSQADFDNVRISSPAGTAAPEAASGILATAGIALLGFVVNRRRK